MKNCTTNEMLSNARRKKNALVHNAISFDSGSKLKNLRDVLGSNWGIRLLIPLITVDL